eukprot:COSAG04_NODE_17790_length_459_cov_0.558333_1_plen_59_part_00
MFGQGAQIGIVAQATIAVFAQRAVFDAIVTLSSRGAAQSQSADKSLSDPMQFVRRSLG